MKSFSRLVHHPGNSNLVRAAQLSVLATLNGISLHVHAEGVRGTGKTSVLRACRALLPTIDRLSGCPYNCDPRSPHCPQHQHLDPERLQAIGTERVQMPFLEISPSAKLGTVVGSLDLERLIGEGTPAAAMLPGTIPRAHRGIVFVDEINRLADTAPELADVLLDVMGTRPGRIQLEESGLDRVELPVVASVWAASNPDEEPGPLDEIRRQLSDRFDLVVPVRRPSRREVVERILDVAEADSVLRPSETTEDDIRVRDSLANRSEGLGRVELGPGLRTLIASVYVEFQLESLRAAEALQVCGRLNALLDGRWQATADDLLVVAPLVLEHRVDPQLIPRILKYMESWRQERDPAPPHRGTPVASEQSGPASDGRDRPAAPASAVAAQDDRQSSSAVNEGGWLQRTLSRFGGDRRTGAGCLTQTQAGHGKGQAGDGVADPMRTPVLAPPARASRLSDLDERAAVSEPIEADGA